MLINRYCLIILILSGCVGCFSDVMEQSPTLPTSSPSLPVSPSPLPFSEVSKTSQEACTSYPQLQCIARPGMITIRNISSNTIYFDTVFISFQLNPADAFTQAALPFTWGGLSWAPNDPKNIVQANNIITYTASHSALSTLGMASNSSLYFAFNKSPVDSPPTPTHVKIYLLSNSGPPVTGPLSPAPSPTPTTAYTPAVMPPLSSECPSNIPNPIVSPNPYGSLSEVMSEDEFNAMFPNRNAIYTYDGFVQAASLFSDFANVGNIKNRKLELAAFLANIAHETTGGWPTAPGGTVAWGLYFIRESGCSDTTSDCNGYNDSTNTTYPVIPSQMYYGRGPIQISWNYNYGFLSDTYYGDKKILLCYPDYVANNSLLAWVSALFFWMTPQPPKPSAHAVMTGLWTPTPADISANRCLGFGTTINIINGGLECGKNFTPTDPLAKPRQNRIDHYIFFGKKLGLSDSDLGDPTSNAMTCNQSTHF